MLFQDGSRLCYKFDAEILWIEPWGNNALRVRATKSEMPTEDWALLAPTPVEPKITVSQEKGEIVNGQIRGLVSRGGKLSIYNSEGKLLLEEYSRNRRDVLDPKCSAIEIEAREFKSIPGSDSCHLTLRLESVSPNEKIFGMGQYQQPYLDLKGLDLELAHRNSQASVPFALSSLGYGLLWNNPAIGRAVLGKNIMSFEAFSTQSLDYWVVAGETPAQIIESYADATGKVPMMPEYGLGFWQCKLRYQTQEELLEVAREYRRRDLPIDLIVIDFFHWPHQGDWKFDERCWPDPGKTTFHHQLGARQLISGIDAMVKELTDLKIELMVSIWPTVDRLSDNYAEMLEHGYLIRVDRGVRVGLDFEGQTIHFDATNPKARQFVWERCRSNYFAKGIKTFWLDEAEPEYSAYDFDNFRYHRGPNLRIGNIYPVDYARTFYEGQETEGQQQIVNLIRCAWAGSQKFGALVWSGDIASSWSSFRNQLAAGLNMGIAGIPWWTTDIGGFHGGDPNDEQFRELFIRWFQWGTFCPVMRLHGDREPRQIPDGVTVIKGTTACSGADNEVWSYGAKAYEICKKYMFIREKLRDYTRRLMREAHEKGTPVMRPLLYEFPGDQKAWEVGEQYMYGDTYLCCPVLAPGTTKQSVYLPRLGGSAQWTSFETETTFEGGQVIEIDCPLDTMPVFVKSPL